MCCALPFPCRTPQKLDTFRALTWRSRWQRNPVSLPAGPPDVRPGRWKRSTRHDGLSTTLGFNRFPPKLDFHPFYALFWHTDDVGSLLRVYRSIFQLLLSGSPFYTLSLSGAAPRRLFLVLPATASSCCTSSDSLSRMIIGLVRGSPTARKWKFCTAFSSGEQPDSGSCTPNSIVYTPKSILVPENTPHSLTQLSSFGSTLLSVYLLDCCTCSCHSTTTNGDFPDTGFRMFLSTPTQSQLLEPENEPQDQGESLESLDDQPFNPYAPG